MAKPIYYEQIFYHRNWNSVFFWLVEAMGRWGDGFYFTGFVMDEFWLQYTSEKGEENKNTAATRSHIKGHFVLSPERKHVDRAVTCSHFGLFLYC
jgi:hypothetical protein